MENEKTKASKENAKQDNVKMVSLEQLIKKKLEKDGRKTATKEIFVESLNANITVKNPTDMQRIDFADKTKSGSYVDMFDGYSKLIYDCCPMLHSKELQDSIGVVYPYDTISAIFDTDEIADIGVQVLNFFDDEEENDVEEKVKN